MREKEESGLIPGWSLSIYGDSRVEFWQNSGLWGWGALFTMFNVYSSSGDVSSEIYKVVAQGEKMWLEISVLM